MTEHIDTSGWFDEKERKNCPFNHTKICPHQLQDKNPIWCQVCVMLEMLNALELIRATQS